MIVGTVDWSTCRFYTFNILLRCFCWNFVFRARRVSSRCMRRNSVSVRSIRTYVKLESRSLNLAFKQLCRATKFEENNEPYFLWNIVERGSFGCLREKIPSGLGRSLTRDSRSKIFSFDPTVSRLNYAILACADRRRRQTLGPLPDRNSIVSCHPEFIHKTSRRSDVI